MIENIVEVQNKMDPSDLIIEVHERYFADMTSALQVALEQLCKRGYQIVISRFASHHTALHSLRTIPVKGIKFHAECFMGGKNGEREKTILKNIVIMAKELGMTVYCGGIHTKLQEEYAREIVAICWKVRSSMEQCVIMCLKSASYSSRRHPPDAVAD